MLTLVTGHGDSFKEFLKNNKTVSIETKYAHPRVVLEKLHNICIDCERHPKKDIIVVTNNIFVVRAAKIFALRNNCKILLKEFIDDFSDEWLLSIDSIHDLDLVLLGIEQYEEEVDIFMNE